ncbi:phosphopantetheine-binding protein [Shewanella sp. 1_MG-2023]|uniref:type I polyketide synthase n=1 Tax=unclassified Shewanella TaxID=196818 RepID=UPI0026E12ADD|nr:MULTISPECIES: type I polyketide synthase [unclassified Shewanella]MDO6610187.1 phosphopantetheine-binding protein [Shewanella sp. 7_MG-2023]MDO6769671.1 phosphopantetheine-binding protein [Shewanella sp. 2_MG-2023]MDO6792735.1 phosphopantetheine-binding protein [Shewanella sp. 1_MG-2023]
MSQTPTNPETPSQENSQYQDSRLNKRLKDMPIAIVGMAGIFANSRYLNKFWDLISEKIDAITEVPESHWRPEDYFDADKSTPDKSYCKRGGFIPEVDFNPMEFGLPPNILELTDTSQLLSLVIAKEVLADAGVTSEYDTDKIGITLGVGGGQKINASLTARLQYPVLKKVFKSSGLSDADSDMLIKKFQDQYIHWEENSFPGSLGNVIAGRIANRFDLGGMNCVVDAACAGSLAAMRMALTELVEGRSEMMITGGVCTDNSPSMYMSFSKTPAFTTNETIQPFDIDSKGMMIGEGIGMVALKRLEDAERDGDRIYSVIKGVGASSDGKFKSIYAPRPEGQAKALKRAYDDAGFAPETVGLIEAHGTGTAAGDVAEFNGLKSVFGENDPTKQHIALGSVKSQVGHTKSTAGTAGVIKAALALHHKVLPPTINVSKPNPKLNVEDSPFFVNTETRPWMPRPDGTPRRAGISSFGFGGTNFHLVLEEYSPEHGRDDKYRQRQVAQSLLISADNKTALIAEVNKLTAEISALKGTDNSSIEQAELTRIAKQYAVTKIENSAARLGLVVSSLTELTTQLGLALKQLNNDSEAWQLPSGTSYRSSALITVTTKGKKATSEPKVAALFAGQGSQYVNMGIEVACHFPEMRQQLIKADKVFASFDKTPLSQVMFPIPAFEKADKDAQVALLTSTDNAQSAIGVVSMSQYQLLSQAGFSADMFAGHSFGELSALCAAGVISNDDYYQLSYARGAAMASSAIDKDGNELDKGTMYAIILPANDADAANSDNIAKLETCIAEFDGVKVANYNSATQLVIAGPTESCAQAAKAISALGFKAIALPVSGAFHTPLVGHAQKPFAKAIDKAKFTASKVELFSNASGEKHPTDAKSIKAAFKQHMLQSVRFTDQLNSMYDAGARVFVEFGPKNILQKLVEATLGNKAESVSVISINPNPKGNSDLQLRIAAMQLNVLGAPLTEVDPYQAEIAAPAVPKGMNVKLTASNHISAPTRAKMEKSLTTGKVTSQIVETVVEKVVEVPVEKVVEKIVEKEVIKTEYVEVAASGSIAVSNAAAQAPQKIAPQAPAQSAPASGSLEAFFNAQQQAADLHQQFLAIPQQYGDTFTHLMAEQSKMAAAGHAIPESLQRSMELFHQHQAQTLQSHTLFLEQQAQSSQNALSMLTGQAPVATAPVVAVPVINTPRVNAPIAATPVITAPAPVVETVKVAAPVQAPVSKPAAMAAPAPRIEPVKAPAPITAPVVAPVVAAAPAGLNAETVLNTMLEVVAEKTGYPTEMLELSMDMEADLGIDSIKRVEILGTVQDELPTLPELSPEDLAECRTLGEIVDYMNSKLPAEGTQIAAQTAVAAPASGLSAETVLNTMLEVVAEKTGYPTEMLELSMDMEADLGIDSIKRVEILGTVQDELPTLPELSPEDLAECRTLGEIVSYMNSKLPAEDSKLPTSAAEGSQLPTTGSAPVGLSAEQVQSTMMTVVAEKTGYPTEMLELSMDMEADLGIDSIKRVEILGTVQDELPTLPELSPEDLAECRTLGEIVSYMNSKLPAEGSKLPTSAAEGSQLPTTGSAPVGLSAEQVQSTMMTVVAEKTGYPTEMLELSMDMEADLGIDSIKRVEILGTVQDELPTLPELSPEDLAECRTLGEIVSYMNSKLPAVSANTVTAPVTQVAPANNGLSAQEVQNTMMTVVAEKTGYPTEMLELSMDMEADLGIDSIKRVEILGTVQDELPGLPELNPEDLAECRTLGEIVSYMNSKLLPTSAAAGANTQAAAGASQVAAPAVSGLSAETALSAPSGLSAEQVQSTMMTVVAEKTGYPTEMLELSMDMEADLGIDSIKRVEILGTVQDELPGLPDLNPEDLAECRTLGEIVSYMNSKLTTSSVVNTAASTAAAPTATADLANDLPPHQEVALKKLPAADKLVDCFSKDACIVINDDGHNAGVLAEKLVATGLTVAVIRSPESVTSAQSPLSSDIASFTLSTVSDDAISDVIAKISKQHKIAGFVHLQPQLATSGNLPLSDAGFIAVEQAFLMAKHLQSRFSELAQSQRVSFMTVSRIDGGFGYLNTTELAKAELNQAALSGLTKTLGHEWPNVFCRALDIAPSFEAVELAQAVIAELYDVETSIAEVGVSDQGRHTLTATTAAQTRYQTTSLNSSDTVLVTGGAKGVTFECALTLAKQTQSHFILAGRSAHLAANLPTWAQNKQASELKAAAIKFIQSQGDKPTPKQIDALVWPITSSLEIDRSLAAFKAVGASAEYISMDVSSDAAIKQSLAGIKPITGIIHGAGVLADKHIQDKTLAELGRVYGTKVSGFAGIINAIDASQLKLVAMFSSAAGFYGNTGQSDYSMSNEILNKTALQLAANYPQAKVMSFNWGPWDGGMVSSALKKMFVERGVYVIPLDKGANLFAHSLLSESGVQLLIGSSMQGSASTEGAAVKKLNADSSHNAEGSLILSLNNAASHRVVSNTVSVERVLNPVAMPFIEDHCIAGNPVLPTVCAIQWMRETAQQLCGLPVLVQDYKLLKGIIFETKEPQVLTLKLTQTESGLTALIASRMQSDDVDSLLRPQYQASLLVNEKVVNEKVVNEKLGNVAVSDTLPTVAKDAQQLVESGKIISTDSELYSNGSLFHGPRLQGIKQLLIADDKQLVCSVELPQIDAKDCASFTPQTGLGGSQAFAEDLLLQAMLVWARIKHDAASLPSTIGELTTYAPFASGDSGYLVLNVVKSTSRSLTADIALYHQDGRLSCTMTNAKTTISKSLNEAFLAPAKALADLQESV